jgi:transposase InsO family protein
MLSSEKTLSFSDPQEIRISLTTSRYGVCGSISARDWTNIRRVLTDNGPCYKANNFARICVRLGLKHRRTRPYTPRTNGKAERFIKTAINV